MGNDFMSLKDRCMIILALLVIMILVIPFMLYPYSTAIVWDPIEELSSDKKIEYQRYPAIAAENGKVYVVWADNDGKDYNIVFREHDGGDWQAEEQLNPADMNIDQWNPDVAVDGGDVHAVWHDSVNGDWDIMYRKKTAGVWGSIQEISEDISFETQKYPKVAALGGNVYVVWQDGGDGDWDICFRYHNGVSWSSIQKVNIDSGTEAQTYPCIAAGGGKAYVVWVDGGGGDKDIMMRTWEGAIWGSIMEISEDTSDEEQDEPEVAYDAEILHIVWQEFQSTDRDILYRSWNGMSFSSVVEVSMDSGTEFQNVPSIDAQFGIVHFVWADRGDGDWDIVYRQYNGSTWLTPQEISADISTESQYLPDIAIDNGVVHVVWEDPGDGDNDIFYRRGNETAPEDIFPPEIQSVLLEGQPTLYIPQGTVSVTLTATMDDSATGGSIIGGANYTLGAQNWPSSTVMIPDNTLDSSTEGFHATIDTDSLDLGAYEFYVYGWDEVLNKNILGMHAALEVVPAIALEEGWNLVSFPQIVSNTTLGSVLGSIGGDYDAVRCYNRSGTDDHWKNKHISKSPNLNDMDHLDNKIGFWLHVTALGGTTLVVEGELPSRVHTVPLLAGWNLVGYPSLTSYNRTNGLNNTFFGTDINCILWYNATSKTWHFMEENDYFRRGTGYWFHATDDVAWNVPL